MKLLLVNSNTNIILNIKDISESDLPLDPTDPSEENYYITSQDYKVGDVYKYD